VLKDGQLVETRETSTLDMDTLVRLMIGRELSQLIPKRSQPMGDIGLEVRTLKLREDSENIAFHVRRGEILGLAGLEGQGAQAVVRALSGLEKAVICDYAKTGPDGESEPVPASSGIASVIRHGIGYVPEDRKTEGLYLDLSIEENIALGKVQKMPLWAIAPHEESAVEALVKRINVVASSTQQTVGSLSGGNQQKVMLGRWLFSVVDLLLINDPTRGVDVGSRADVYTVFREFTNAGGMVVLASREMNELIGLCDRILVVHNHSVQRELAASEATEEAILSSAVGRAHSEQEGHV
jgi:ribose transport system ATP-binding protein